MSRPILTKYLNSVKYLEIMIKIAQIKCEIFTTFAQNRQMKTFLFLLFLVVNLSVFSQAKQDSIILLNGRVFTGDIDKVENDFIFYDQTNKKGESERIEMSTYRVFSYTQDGNETVIYKQDEFKGDYLSIEETRHTTLGSYDARKTYKPRFVFWSSLLLGIGASVFDTYFSQKSFDALTDTVGGVIFEPDLNVGYFGSSPSIFPFVVPVVLSVSWGLPTFRIKEHQILQKDMFGNEMYYRGFHRIAKQKRIFASLKGSLIGIAAGMISYSIFKIN